MSGQNSNELHRLIGRLSTVKADGLKITSLASGLKAGQSSSTKSLSAGNQASMGLKSSSFNSKTVNPLRFGAPSHNTTGSSRSGTSELTSLIKQTSSGGVSSVFGGGLSGGLLGVAGLFSQIAGIFGGGHSAPPPLTLFQLPDSQAQDVSIGSSVKMTTGNSPQADGIYSAGAVSAHGSDQTGVTSSSSGQSAQIVETVKQALLNSSSLNDVIAEI